MFAEKLKFSWLKHLHMIDLLIFFLVNAFGSFFILNQLLIYQSLKEVKHLSDYSIYRWSIFSLCVCGNLFICNSRYRSVILH